MKRTRFLLLPLLTLVAAAQIPAFPGAEGYGAYAKGGRGGDVYHVTNLNTSGVGSFADAIATVPVLGRTIVFDVSGHIHINKTTLSKSNVTIAGQTAPGDGIGFKDGTFIISGDDIVIRHARFRYGDKAAGGDCIDLSSGTLSAILDQVSIEFSTDENISSFNSPPENLTMQWSLNGWGLESHSCGGLWDQNHASSHHSLWAHNHTRNPKARPNGLLEWVNNVTFDWDIGFIMGDSNSNASWKANVRGCYFLSPPGNLRSKALEKALLQTSNGLPNFSLYLDNCLHDADGDGLLNGTNKGYGIASGSYNTNATPFAGSPAGVTIDAPVLAFKKVLSKAGPQRLDVSYTGDVLDEVDAKMVNNVLTQTRNHISKESSLGLTNGGFGTLNSTPAPVDTDRDGMPDYYEIALGWNPAVQDHNSVMANSGGLVTGYTYFPAATVAGYTRLEEYLHFLATPHGLLAKNIAGTPSSIQVDLRKFTKGFVKLPVFSLTNVTNGTAVQTGAGNYLVTFTPPLNYLGRAKFDFTVTDTDGSAWIQTCNLLVSASGLPRDLSWKGDGTANVWDIAANNWLRSGAATAFSTGDRVTFDDSGSLTPAVAVSGTLSPATVEVSATGNYTFGPTGAVTSTGTLTKRGSGTLTLMNAGPNTFSSVSLDEGLLSLGNFSAGGSGKMALNGGSLYLSAGTANPLEFNAPTTITVASQQTMTGNWTGSKPVTINATSSQLWSLSGTWTGFTGGINLGTGNAKIRLNGGSSNSMYGSTAVSINLGGGSSQLMNRNGSASTPFDLGSLESTGTATILSGTQTGSINSTYSIGALNTNTSFAGNIVNGGGTTAITKVGSGAWTLSGVSTYTGPTAVNAGTLIIAGNLGNSPLTVASGAVLAGSGTLGGSVTASSGAFISPATIPFTGATLTAAGLALNGNTLYFDMYNSPAAANDKIVLTSGALAMTGSQYFQFLLLQNTLSPGSYDLITGASSISASGYALTHNLPVGTRQTFDLAAIGNIVRLTVTGDPATLTWTGAASANWDTTTANNWTGASPNIFGSNDAVIIDDSSAITNIALPAPVTPRSTLVNNTTRPFTIAGGINGGSLTKSGTHSLTLGGANTFAGGLTLNAGTILLDTDTANNAGLGTGSVTLNAGVISMHDDDNTYNAFTANLVVPAGATARLNADARVDMYGSLAGAGTLNFYAPWVRTTLFANWSAFTGIINVLTDAGGGDFRMGTSYGFPGFPQAAVALSDKVWAYYTGTLAGGVGTLIEIGELSGMALSVLQGGATGGRALTYRIGGRNTNATFAGVILEQNTTTATSYIKTGGGSWTLSGSGAWNGGTTVEQGILTIGGAFSCLSATDVQSGATLQLSGGSLATDAVNVSVGAVLAGNGTLTGDLNNDGTVTSLTGGSLAVTGDVVNNGLMRIASGTALVATGNFVNNGILDLLTAAQGLPANLENNGIVIDSSTLAMTTVLKSGSVVTVKVPTHSGHAYQMQRSASLVSGWTDVSTSQNGVTTILGAPTERTFTDSAATSSKYFYRIKVTP